MTQPGPSHGTSAGHYEMLWDCPFCDTKGNLGLTHRHCPNCGAVQDETKRYFPPAGTEKPVEQHAFVGADRVCGSCRAPNSAKAHNCGKCGAPLDGTATAKLVDAPRPVAAPKAKRPPWVAVAIAVAVILVGGLLYWRCRTKTVSMTVAAHKWERTIAIEELKRVEESAWRDGVPSDASGRSCVTKKRTTKQVPDGEECHTVNKDKGDGTFEKVNQCTTKYRSEDVMDDYCTYTVERWKEVDKLEARGVGLSPAWPAVPALTGGTSVGSRRVGPKTETLHVEFATDGKVQGCEVSDAVWRKYVDGKPAKVKIRAASGDLVCGAL